MVVDGYACSIGFVAIGADRGKTVGEGNHRGTVAVFVLKSFRGDAFRVFQIVELVRQTEVHGPVKGKVQTFS